MKTAPKMKTTPQMDIPQKNKPKNEEDFTEVKITSKRRHILRLYYLLLGFLIYWYIALDVKGPNSQFKSTAFCLKTVDFRILLKNHRLWQK